MTTPTTSAASAVDPFPVRAASPVVPVEVTRPGRLTCAACHRDLDPGEALAVTPADPTAQPFVVCRPGVRSGCLTAAGTRHEATIELYDPGAARALDRVAGEPDFDRLAQAVNRTWQRQPSIHREADTWQGS